MTSLTAELLAAPPPIIGKQRCNFGRALDAFPDDVDAILAKAAPGPGREERRRTLQRVLRDNGHPNCGESTVDRHLRRTCVCYQ